MWQALISPIASLATSWLGNKAEEKQAKHKRRITQIEQDGSWEDKMAEGSMSSWKDEYWTIVLSLPILSIIWGITLNDPEIITRTQVAFTTLDSLPEWYQYLLWVAVLASFGIKGVKSWIDIKKGG
jgi:hypothetical protein